MQARGPASAPSSSRGRAYCSCRRDRSGEKVEERYVAEEGPAKKGRRVIGEAVRYAHQPPILTEQGALGLPLQGMCACVRVVARQAAGRACRRFCVSKQR